MFGLLNKQVDKSLLEEEYETGRKQLTALLEADLLIIKTEQKQIFEAVKALKNSKVKLTRDHIDIIRSRLVFVHSNILKADQEIKKTSEHFPIEATTLNQLTEKAEQIFQSIRQLKQTSQQKK